MWRRISRAIKLKHNESLRNMDEVILFRTMPFISWFTVPYGIINTGVTYAKVFLKRLCLALAGDSTHSGRRQILWRLGNSPLRIPTAIDSHGSASHDMSSKSVLGGKSIVAWHAASASLAAVTGSLLACLTLVLNILYRLSVVSSDPPSQNIFPG